MADVPSPNTKMKDRREALRAYRKVRTTLSWIKAAPDTHFPAHTTVRAFGPVCCLLSDRSLRFIQPECQYRGREKLDWTLENLEFAPKAFAYDHSQRLLMLIERTSPYVITVADSVDGSPNNSRTEYMWRLHLRCSNTGNPHPLSPKPFIEFRCDYGATSTQNHWWKSVIEIRQYASIIVVNFLIFSEVSIFWTWNWKTGALLYVSLVPLCSNMTVGMLTPIVIFSTFLTMVRTLNMQQTKRFWMSDTSYFQSPSSPRTNSRRGLAPWGSLW